MRKIITKVPSPHWMFAANSWLVVLSKPVSSKLLHCCLSLKVIFTAVSPLKLSSLLFVSWRCLHWTTKENFPIFCYWSEALFTGLFVITSCQFSSVYSCLCPLTKPLVFNACLNLWSFPSFTAGVYKLVCACVSLLSDSVTLVYQWHVLCGHLTAISPTLKGP